MTTTAQKSGGRLASLVAAYRDGAIDRRQFVATASALGISASLTVALANSAGAQTPSPDASAEASPIAASTIPSVGTENQTRGEGGELRLLQWQAPTLLNPSVSTGTKDTLAASLVLEPLLRTLADGSFAPLLVTVVPSQANGTIAEDLTSITFTLLPDLRWSDGEPVTSADLQFTWQWHTNPDNSSFNFDEWNRISAIDTPDEQTAVVTFTQPNPVWFDVFANPATGLLYPKHVLEAGGAEVNNAFALKPIGTGPFVVDTFTPGDQVTYRANEHYREPNKPYFASVVLKGGGDAASAARAVLQTGEYDFAWNLQVEPEVLSGLQSEGGPGVVVVSPTISLEYIEINHSDPRTEVDGEVSQKDTPHPIFSDLKVREALRYAIDREQIASAFYLQPGNPAISNVVLGNPLTQSPNTSLEFSPEKAGALLDEAGWVLDGDVRKKDGVELSITFATSVNQVRQKTQQLVKSQLEKVGIKVELVQVDAGQYFDGSPGNTQNITHFPWDIQEYGRPSLSAFPVTWLNFLYAGPNGENVAQKANNWSGNNYSRWQSPEFDALLEATRTETDSEALIEKLIQLNDIAFNDVANIPLVQVGQPIGHSRSLNPENFGFTPFDYQYWNIANWNRVSE